ncbi:hypothetical protein [Paenibacillus chitinolyticus]|uniref:hypothetical protein n=1 Tax=Paenibacillus chitinolyticus TaxID=79263 RepID=UPI003D011D25
MQVFVKYIAETEERGRVTLMDYRPDLLSEEELKEGVVIDYEEAKNTPQGKSAVLYVNPETSQTWYEYEDRLLSPSEETRELKKDIADIQLALAELLMNV